MKIARSHLEDYGLPIALALLGVSLRVLFIKDFLGEWDEVDFALAMRDYDIAADQPHFPGYPVFIWLCQLTRMITHDDVKALTLTSAVLGGLTALPLYYLARDMYSQMAAVLTTGLFIVNPLCWLHSERAMSDAAGLFFLLLSLFILHRAYLSPATTAVTLPVGAALFGVTLGVRLSYLPFLVFLAYVLVRPLGRGNPRLGHLYILGALLLGIMVWLVPLATSVAGLKSLSSQAVFFAGGHFTDWGGSAITSPDIFYRLKQVLYDLFCHGLGLWWLDVPHICIIPTIIFLTGIVVFLKDVLKGQEVGLVFAIILPYALWVLFAQNVEKPRHILPVVPFVLMFISAGILNIGRDRRLVAVLAILAVLTTGVSSLRLVAVQARTLPPMLQVVDYVTDNFDELSTRIYCGQSKRLFEYYAPGWDARRVRDIEELRYDLGASIYPQTVILATSEVKGVSEGGIVVHRFEEDKHVFVPYHRLVLYSINPGDL